MANYDLSKFEILDNPTILVLINTYRATDDTDARNAVLESNLRTVFHLAHKFGKNNRESFDELVHVGIVAIIDAINNFDETKSPLFSSYCYTYIRGYMLNKLNDRFHSFLSLSNTINGSDGNKTTFEAQTEDQKTLTPEDEMIKSDDHRNLYRAIETLNARDGEIIKQYFGLGTGNRKTFEEIGQGLGMTKQGVRAVVLRSLTALKMVL